MHAVGNKSAVEAGNTFHSLRQIHFMDISHAVGGKNSYAQIKKEALAVAWARMQEVFILGRSFLIEPDNNPPDSLAQH